MTHSVASACRVRSRPGDADASPVVNHLGGADGRAPYGGATH